MKCMDIKKKPVMTKRDWFSLACAIGVAVLITFFVLYAARWWMGALGSISEGARQKETIMKNADTYPEYIYDVKDYKIVKMTKDTNKSKEGKGFEILTNDTGGLYMARVSYTSANGRLYGMEQAVFIKYSEGVTSPELHVKRVNIKGRYKGLEINPTLYLPNKKTGE